MAQWKRLSRSGKVLFLTAVLIVVALTAWAANRQLPTADAVAAEGVSTTPTNAETLSAPLPPPMQVFIQATNAFPDEGNVLVKVTLSKEQLDRKTADGTRDFVTIGTQDQMVILRDDGQQGDAAAGDGEFTGIGNVDDMDLQARSDADQAELAASTGKFSPVFAGRTYIGDETPQAFDLAGFRAGKAVPFDPAVAFVEPDTASAQTSAAAAKAVVLGTNTFQERVLMIRHLGVVTDPAAPGIPAPAPATPTASGPSTT